METKQTAVEWLIGKMAHIIPLSFNNLIEEAKEMEKEQIIDAAHHGVDFENSPYKDAEEYYNETYKS